MAILHVDEQVGTLLAGEGAAAAGERALIRMHALMSLERPLAGAGVRAAGAAQGASRSVLAGVCAQGRLGCALEVTFRTGVGTMAQQGM